jgi:glycolate oxidase FAD binding subunit
VDLNGPGSGTGGAVRDVAHAVRACGCLTRLDAGPETWGLAPLRTDRPRTAREAADALAAAGAARESAWIVGAATRLAACPPVPEHAVVVSSAALSGVVAFEPADLTLTVRGGTTLEEIHDLLASRDLELPASHFGLASGTIGGAIATDLADARRGRHGPLRDRILGMEIATSDGRVSRSGGRVVKNVSGYAVGRLVAGSCGALALVTEVTLRLAPRPEAHAAFERAAGSLTEATEDAVTIARHAPAVGLVAAIGRGHDPRTIWVHEGERESVDAAVRWSVATLGARGGHAVADDARAVESRLLLNALEHVCPLPTNLLLRAAVRPTALVPLLSIWQEMGLGFVGGFVGQGAAFARLDATVPDAFVRFERAAAAVIEAGGSWRVLGAGWPLRGRDDATPWGGIRTPWELYRRIRMELDPTGCLGPHAFDGPPSVAGGGSAPR